MTNKPVIGKKMKKEESTGWYDKSCHGNIGTVAMVAM